METIAIVMPCYNAARTLKETLTSIAEQSYETWKLYAVNDGSTDETLDILNTFKAQFPGKVVILNQENKGQVKSKNAALKAIDDATYVAFLDADDLWDSDKLFFQQKFLKEKPEIGLVYTNGYFIDKNSKMTGKIGVNDRLKGHCLNEFLIGNAIVASSVMIKRSLLKKVGLFDESLTACENWELWTRIASVAEVDVLNKPLVYYRRHTQNMSHDSNRMKKNRIQVIHKNQEQYSQFFSDISIRTRFALFKAYAFFGENALWHLNVKEARRDLLHALLYRPHSLKCWFLLFKSLLGRTVINFVRRGNPSRYGEGSSV